MGRLIIDTKHLKISGSALLSFSSSHLSQQGRLSLTNLWNQIESHFVYGTETLHLIMHYVNVIGLDIRVI